MRIVLGRLEAALCWQCGHLIARGPPSPARRSELREPAVDYAMHRKTFGAPIIDHQPIGFKIADMDMKIRAARHLAYEANTALDAGAINVTHLSSVAKCFTSDVAMEVASHAVDIFGGNGYSRRHPAQRVAIGSSHRTGHAEPETDQPAGPSIKRCTTMRGQTLAGRILNLLLRRSENSWTASAAARATHGFTSPHVVRLRQFGAHATKSA